MSYDSQLRSFATDRCAMKIGPCPQCPESDGWPSKRRLSRWAIPDTSLPAAARLCDLAGVLDEKLRDRAKRAIL